VALKVGAYSCCRPQGCPVTSVSVDSFVIGLTNGYFPHTTEAPEIAAIVSPQKTKNTLLPTLLFPLLDTTLEPVSVLSQIIAYIITCLLFPVTSFGGVFARINVTVS